jgi:hypothetical protein
MENRDRQPLRVPTLAEAALQLVPDVNLETAPYQIATDMRDWDKAFTPKGFERKEEGGGGSCLYYSIAALLNKRGSYDTVKGWLAGAWQGYVNGEGFVRCPTLSQADTSDLEHALIAWAGDANLHTRATTTRLKDKPLSVLACARGDFVL